MDKPRFPAARPLALVVWLGSIAAVGFWGCQGPDTFLRKLNGGGGSGGNPGVGGGVFAAGGHLGSGGFTGAGGFSSGSGGSSFGTGGSVGTGGRTGAGGSSGVGGARDGGADTPGAGGAVVDANPDSEGGIVSSGTGPCMGLCAPAVVFVSNPNYPPNGTPPTTFLATQSACYETTSNLQGGGCSNCGGRTISINGSPPASTWPSVLPAAVRGGFCIQISAGMPGGGAVDYASFYTFSF